MRVSRLQTARSGVGNRAGGARAQRRCEDVNRWYGRFFVCCDEVVGSGGGL